MKQPYLHLWKFTMGFIWHLLQTNDRGGSLFFFAKLADLCSYLTVRGSLALVVHSCFSAVSLHPLKAVIIPRTWDTDYLLRPCQYSKCTVPSVDLVTDNGHCRSNISMWIPFQEKQNQCVSEVEGNGTFLKRQSQLNSVKTTGKLDIRDPEYSNYSRTLGVWIKRRHAN